MTDPVVEALLRERRGYAARNLPERVAAVDAELARLGHRVPATEAAVGTAPERAVPSKPAPRARRNTR